MKEDVKRKFSSLAGNQDVVIYIQPCPAEQMKSTLPAKCTKGGLIVRVFRYGVPDGAPAICHENARNDEAVRSIAGSTVE